MSKVDIRTTVFDEVITNPLLGINHQNPRKVKIDIWNRNNRSVLVNKVSISLKLLFLYIPVKDFNVNRRVNPNSTINHTFLLRELKNLPSFFHIRIEVFVDGERNIDDIYLLKDFRLRI